MSIVETEQVMVVRTDLFRECGYFEGFCEQADQYLPILLNPENTQYLPRDKMELDPEFKQLIPYCIFQHVAEDGEVHVFQYRRGKGQGESRLHSKRSVGIGGHISTLDAADSSPYDLGMQRELEEEIAISTRYEQKRIGMINDDSNEVGQVHLGVVHLFDVEQPLVVARETEIVESGFLPVRQLLTELDDFETWSQICLKAIFGKP